jgi:hypothetical protein
MKEIELIKRTIKKYERGKPFTASSLEGKGSYENVCQVLSRLVASGKLKRATRGVYVRPKKVPYLGEVSASSEAVVKTIAKQTGEVITVHGAEAARQLRLTTQAPVKPIYNTSGTSRELKIGKQTVILKHISPRKQVKPGTMTCTVIAALWYLGKNTVNESVINMVRRQISEEQFVELLKHKNKMPHWMSSAFENYKERNEECQMNF